MRVDVDEHDNIRFSEVFNPVVISTDVGEFGICQRDGGIEVSHNGKLVFAQYTSVKPGMVECGHAASKLN